MTKEDRSRSAKKAWVTRKGKDGGIVTKEDRPPRIQLFRASPQAGLVGMSNAGFENEKLMQALVERNIGALFPDLKFLKTEDRDMTEGKRRPDTIAFDTNLDTFVVIEYKNKRDRGVVSQVKAYLRDMRGSKGDLTLAYREQSGHNPRDRSSFDWNHMYAIIIATEFDPLSIQGTYDDANVEMYEIEMYDDHVVVMERVGGAHVREYSIPEDSPPQDTGVPVSLKDLYETIHKRLLNEFPGSEVNTKPKDHDGFRYPNKPYFCTTQIQKSKIWMWYYDNASKIRSLADFEQALDYLKELHGGGNQLTQI